MIFNTYRFTLASRLSSSRSQLFLATMLTYCSTIVLAYIFLIRSFFCHEIYQTLGSHHTTIICTLATLILLYKHHVYSLRNI